MSESIDSILQILPYSLTVMNSSTQAQINYIVADLELLIAEIENNPDLPKWVVRMALKAIRDKAKKAAKQAAQTTDYAEQRALLN